MKRDFQRVIAIVNNKGGVGKTTSALNIAAGLAMRGRKVLIIDLDPQANASLALLGPEVLNLPTSIYDVLLEEDKPLRDIITPTPIKGLDLAPSHPNLANAEVNLTAVLGREKVLKRSLDHPNLAITGVIATFFDGRTRLSHEILENIRTYFGDVVFQATIRKNVKLDEAQSHHQSVFDYAPKSTGSIEYGSLVEEVIQHESTCPRRKSTHETSR
jgi:chromosome partitioning protein